MIKKTLVTSYKCLLAKDAFCWIFHQDEIDPYETKTISWTCSKYSIIFVHLPLFNALELLTLSFAVKLVKLVIILGCCCCCSAKKTITYIHGRRQGSMAPF